jgi:hypothetical protein
MKNDDKIDTLCCCASYELGITRHGRQAQLITGAKDNFIGGSPRRVSRRALALTEGLSGMISTAAVCVITICFPATCALS